MRKAMFGFEHAIRKRISAKGKMFKFDKRENIRKRGAAARKKLRRLLGDL